MTVFIGFILAAVAAWVLAVSVMGYVRDRCARPAEPLPPMSLADKVWASCLWGTVGLGILAAIVS